MNSSLITLSHASHHSLVASDSSDEVRGDVSRLPHRGPRRPRQSAPESKNEDSRAWWRSSTTWPSGEGGKVTKLADVGRAVMSTTVEAEYVGALEIRVFRSMTEVRAPIHSASFLYLFITQTGWERSPSEQHALCTPSRCTRTRPRPADSAAR
ncbi:hypothetical protein CC85DRAFT_166004 [Cutaneotrichosporon oleaginosum]|uniref:Uncharacterized protein n=1 Tax=Cutaneotrichosporon oleaginosum TaxID=879819 RepID=A0A0J0XFW0_9TREE|nr:uncharacterized protein CC85DRAFT_166004 [Cutaneotrichosporon oleaginosum]KLT39960.1 hypothetical protein CC85DRAFT_166004 [Cutaneotrichosporon oleaginosum]